MRARWRETWKRLDDGGMAAMATTCPCVPSLRRQHGEVTHIDECIALLQTALHPSVYTIACRRILRVR